MGWPSDQGVGTGRYQGVWGPVGTRGGGCRVGLSWPLRFLREPLSGFDLSADLLLTELLERERDRGLGVMLGSWGLAAAGLTMVSLCCTF